LRINRVKYANKRERNNIWEYLNKIKKKLISIIIRLILTQTNANIPIKIINENLIMLAELSKFKYRILRYLPYDFFFTRSINFLSTSDCRATSWAYSTTHCISISILIWTLGAYTFIWTYFHLLIKTSLTLWSVIRAFCTSMVAALTLPSDLIITLLTRTYTNSILSNLTSCSTFTYSSCWNGSNIIYISFILKNYITWIL